MKHRPRRVVRADRVLRLPFDLGVRREEPCADRSGSVTAVEDTQKRFGLTVDDFLANPTGTMSVVLSRQIILTPAQKETAIQKLREAFAEHQRQRGSGYRQRG